LNALEFQKIIKDKTSSLPGNEPFPVHYKMYVKEKFDGLLILEYLTKAIPSVSIEKWTEKIESGNLKINGNSVALDFRVKSSWLVEHASEPRIEPFVSNNIQLIYEDEHILVINKPAPLPMHSSGRFVKNTLENLLKIAFPNQEYKLIHRLDANTTGIVVLGKTQEATAFLQQQFQEKAIQKTYLALVEGTVILDKFTSNQQISKVKTTSGGRTTNIENNGTTAFTEFEVLERNNNTTLLKVIPHTGKTNQIRLHLAHSGHAIVGDYGYKNDSYFENNPLTYPEDCLFLHAWKLTFKHPFIKEKISFEAEMPLKFKGTLI